MSVTCPHRRGCESRSAAAARDQAADGLPRTRPARRRRGSAAAGARDRVSSHTARLGAAHRRARARPAPAATLLRVQPVVCARWRPRQTEARRATSALQRPRAGGARVDAHLGQHAAVQHALAESPQRALRRLRVRNRHLRAARARERLRDVAVHAHSGVPAPRQMRRRRWPPGRRAACAFAARSGAVEALRARAPEHAGERAAARTRAGGAPRRCSCPCRAGR